jgi:5-methylcytosine-specific restriction endonuclease McrA
MGAVPSVFDSGTRKNQRSLGFGIFVNAGKVAWSKETDRADYRYMPAHQIGVAPSHFQCDPVSRYFPPEWKDVWFRRFSQVGEDGIPRYQCPMCKRFFDHSSIGYLQGDHIWPYSMLGETSWENYRLICGRCNIAKSDFIDQKLRRALGHGEFRRLIGSCLQDLVSRSFLEENVVLDDLLGHVE